MADHVYGKLRDPDLVGRAIGARLVDVTESEADDLTRFLCFHFDDGTTVTITYVGVEINIHTIGAD